LLSNGEIDKEEFDDLIADQKLQRAESWRVTRLLHPKIDKLKLRTKKREKGRQKWTSHGG
jgi:hypothetical protein